MDDAERIEATPDPALDAMLAKAREDALREAAAVVSSCTWGDYWRKDGENLAPIDLSDDILALIEPAPASERAAARVLLDALNEESELDDVIQTAMQGEADTDGTDEWVFVLRAGLRAIAEGKDDE